MLNFSYIDKSATNIPSQTNGGLYTGNDVLDTYEWSGNYLQPKVIPNSMSYSDQFYSKNIQPYDDRNDNRYGNNTPGYR